MNDPPERVGNYLMWEPPSTGFDILNRDCSPMLVVPTSTRTQTACKQVHIKEEPEVPTPREEMRCCFCGEATHTYQTCLVLRQMVREQAEELASQRITK